MNRADRSQLSRSSRWLVVVAAGVLLSSSCSTEAPASDSTSPDNGTLTTPATASTGSTGASSTTSLAVPTIDWTRATNLQPPPGVLVAMSDGPAGFGAIVSVKPENMAGHHEVWLSSDGLRWDQSYAAPPEVTLNDIAPLEDGWLAGGLRWEPRAEMTSVPVVGSSTAEWQLVGLPTFGQTRSPEVLPAGVDGAGAGVRALTRGGPGVVAAGWFPAPDGFQYGAVWTSRDGIEWQFSAGGPASFGPDPSTIYLVEAVETALLAVGDLGGETAAWISVDGITWDRTARNQVSALPAVSAVASGPEGLVVAGWSQLPPVAFGYSEDGESWRFESFPDAGGLPIGLRATSDGFLAVGKVNDVDAESDGAVWSASGLSGEWKSQADQNSIFGGEGSQLVLYPFCKDGRWYLYGTETFTNASPSAVLWIGTGQNREVC